MADQPSPQRAAAQPVDPTRQQQRAVTPDASRWVEANAGSGKTKVLTDRVLSLLVNGAAPERLLCITFTKAAAAEMANRLHKRLGLWSILDEADLRGEIRALDGASVTPEKLSRARQLFATVLDTPGGLKIQTVHSFCQSLLGRFPLEAGVPPQFSVMDDREAAALMRIARDTVLHAADGDDALAHALATITQRVQEDRFDELMNILSRERARLARTFAGTERGSERTHTAILALCGALGAEPGISEADIVAAASTDHAFDRDGLLKAARIVLEESLKSKNDQTFAKTVLAWIAAAPDGRVATFERYCRAFFSYFGESREKPKDTLVTKGFQKDRPGIEDPFREEQERLVSIRERMRIQATAEASAALIALGARILEAYRLAKDSRAKLDYDDLIVKARDLVTGEDAPPWVLFKLDGGIEHILIDEAQDTNPEQWEIVGALAEEFFAGEGQVRGPRTIFAVGDAKQSIYSFQRADPNAFREMRDHFAERARTALDTFSIPFDFSFRSAEAVLEVVDSTFAELPAKDGVIEPGGADLFHAPQRKGHGGNVELWPLVGIEPEEVEDDAWVPPEEGAVTAQPFLRLAEVLAGEIAARIGGDILPSTGRPATAGDIMVLVRRRSGFVDALVRALKRRNIPVAGADRMVLTEQIAVMDLLALGRFLLLPEDDLTLATILKSPFIGFDDDDLFTLAHGRGEKSLWRRLGEAASGDPRMAAAEFWLRRLLGDIDFVPPFELFSRILNRLCPVRTSGKAPPGQELTGRQALLGRLGSQAEDPIDELLSLALSHEQSGPPTMQGFLAWFASGKAEIKRDLETEDRDEVRILTVHGAKGLQAPIVFLPDTTAKPQRGAGPEVNWLPHRSVAYDGIPLPVWTPNSGLAESVGRRLRKEKEDDRDREYRRLLYVAMTRAEDHLVVCGFEGKRNRPEDCWYDLVRLGLERLDEATSQPFDFTCHGPDGWAGEGIVFARRQTEEPKTATVRKAPDPLPPTPEWVSRKPAKEPSPPRPLAPSRPTEVDPAARSPIEAGTGGAIASTGTLRYQRGRLVHRLLQTLPDIPPENRRDAAARFLARTADGLDDDGIAELTGEVMNVLEAPEFAPIFGSGSRAEVPLTGMLRVGADGMPVAVSGQVDRLLILENEIYVVDYKTLRPAPLDVDKVPPAYIQQMAQYRAILRQIYPDRPVRCALIWTETPRLLTLPDRILSKAVTDS